jgi:hypothetical protein
MRQGMRPELRAQAEHPVRQTRTALARVVEIGRTVRALRKLVEIHQRDRLQPGPVLRVDQGRVRGAETDPPPIDRVVDEEASADRAVLRLQSEPRLAVPRDVDA